MTASGIPISACANGVIFNNITLEARGQLVNVAQPAADCTVFAYVHEPGYVPTGESTRVSVYQDEALTIPMPQPLATDENGNVPGYVATGQLIDLVASGGPLPIPQVLLVNAGSGGGTSTLAGDAAGSASATVVNTVKGGRTPLTADQNLGDVVSAATARANLGLGSAATQSTSVFDAAGAASTAVAGEQARAVAAEAANASGIATNASAIAALTPSVINANPNAAVESAALTGYGNSYQQVGPTICQRRYWERIHDWLRSSVAAASGAHGVSSMIASDISNYAHSAVVLTTAYATAAATWTPATTIRGIVIWEGIRNDAGWDGISTTAKSRAGFVNGLDSFLRLIRAGSSLQDTNAAFVYTGTWTNSPNVKVPGSNSHNTVTPGDHVTITTPVGTDFDLIILGGDTTIVPPAFTVTVDGVDITAALAAAGFPTTGNAQMSETKQVSTCPWVPLAIPLRGLSSAAHTVVLTHAGSAGQTLFVNRLLTPSPTPPTVVINKANQLPAGGYANYVTNGNALGSPSFATDQIYNGLIDTVVARFGVVSTLTAASKATPDQSIVVFDPMAAGWDLTTMIASTDAAHIHPNDKGMGCYADGLRSALNALSPRNGLAIL